MKGLFRWVALFVFLPALANAAPILYGVSSSSPGRVYTIDPTTGAATLAVTITGSSGTSLVGAEFLGSQLWATDVLGSTGFSTGTIDLVTGAYTEVSSQAGSANWHGLAANQATSTFYSVDITGAGQPLISMTTGGAVSAIGATGLSLVGLAYSDTAGLLYAATGTDLYTLNTATGSPTLIGALGVATGSRVGLAYSDALGALYMNTPTGLYTVNTTTGAATFIGSNGSVSGSGIDGLAVDDTGVAAVPEPASLVLLGTGAAGLLARARRRKI